MPEAEYVLKVLSGLHTGAEYVLSQEVVRLGSGEDCDVILHDKGIAAEHLLFSRTGAGMEVRCLAQGQGVFLDGAGQADSCIIPDFGLLNTGSLYLAVGLEDALWRIPAPQQLFSEALPARQAGAEAGAAASPDEDETDDDQDEPGTEATEQNIESEAGSAASDEMATEGEETEPAARVASPRRFGWLLKLGIPAVLILAVVVGWLVYPSGEARPPAPKAPPGPTLAQIEAIADRYRLDAHFELQDKIVLAQGYALHAEDELGLVRALHDKGLLVKSGLIITGQLRHNLELLLEQYLDPTHFGAISVSVDEQDIKTLYLRGYVRDADQWDTLLASVLDEVGSIHYMDEVTHWEDGLGHLQGLLAAQALSEKVFLEQDKMNNRITLYDRTADEITRTRLFALAEQYRKRYSYPEVVVGTEREAGLPPPTFVTSALKGASFNHRPYILFDDQQRYFVGSITPDGYLIEEINEQFAVLSRDNRWYQYHFDTQPQTQPAAPQPWPTR